MEQVLGQRRPFRACTISSTSLRKNRFRQENVLYEAAILMPQPPRVPLNMTVSAGRVARSQS
jgi:hypothetical protein